MSTKLKGAITIKRWYPPKAIIVSPTLRPGSKQLTVIRHDENGQYFVDEFAERSSSTVTENRRNMRYVACPHLEFQVALVACPRYCSAPCPTHQAALAQGWYRNGEKPPSAERMSRRGVSSED